MQNSSASHHLRTKPLTAGQERRLVAYLDEQFLQLTRGYKKRTSPSSIVPTLHTYLSFSRRLLALILQIPPVDPSTSLRTQYLLRLTGDVLNAIVGYTLPSRSGGAGEIDGGGEDEEPRDYKSGLRELLDWLDDLDQAWLAVLQSQVWDPEAGEGVDLVLDVGGGDGSTGLKDGGEEEDRSGEGTAVEPMMNGLSDARKGGAMVSTPVSQTDVARLRSLLVTSVSNLEEWLGKGGDAPGISSAGAGAGGEEDVTGMLERLGLMEEFDELFVRTMDFLGGFGGYVVEPESVGDTVEVEMGVCS